MADITAMRKGLAENLKALPGTQVSAYVISNPTPPSVYVYPGEEEYDKAMGRGTDAPVLIVRAIAGTISEIAAQELLDSYMAGSGETSIKAAIESDTSLGGACEDLRVVSRTGHRSLQIEGLAEALIAEWRVEIIARGTS